MAEATCGVSNEMMAQAGAFPWWSALLWGICAFIIGLCLLSTPISTTVLLITFLGAWWFVGGIFSLISLAVDRTNMGLKIISGLLSLIAGTAIMAYPIYSTVIILPFFVILVGFLGIIIGGTHFYQGYVSKDWGSAILGILSIIFGFLLIIYPAEASMMLPFVVGIFAIIGGLSAIIGSFELKQIQADQAS